MSLKATSEFFAKFFYRYHPHMKSSETTILVIAGHTGADELHWQRRLISRLSSAQLVEQPDRLYGSLATAIDALAAAVAAAPKPVVLIAHSAGCALVAHAVLQIDAAKIRGAFLVVPPSFTARA
jgi:uncharacterized protein